MVTSTLPVTTIQSFKFQILSLSCSTLAGMGFIMMIITVQYCIQGLNDLNDLNFQRFLDQGKPVY
jgi:hypothetical protein